METRERIRVIIADDHDIYRDGLAGLLHKEPGIEIVGEAENGRELLALVKSCNPDVVLTDLQMPVMGGVQAIKEIKAGGYDAKCIVLSVFDSDQLIIEALEAGAMGYIVKNAQKGEIVEAVRTVHRQCPYYCRTTTALLARKISRSSYNPYPGMKKDLFDAREKKIIAGICREMTSDEIAKELFMSRKMVDFIRGRILKKLDVKTTIGIVIYAIKHGIFPAEDILIK